MAGKRVLIVDDEASPRAVIREVLQRSGYEPAEAEGGLEGLAKDLHLKSINKEEYRPI